MCQTAYLNLCLKNMFIIPLSINNLNFLEKDCGFYMYLRVMVKERLKSCHRFFTGVCRIHFLIINVKVTEPQFFENKNG